MSNPGDGASWRLLPAQPARREAGLLLALAAACLLVQVAGFRALRHDDAYITFRYGQNLALGRGLVFNPGERIMGSTSPGMCLLSAGVYPLAGREHLPDVMSALGCVGWTAQAVALYVLLLPALGARGALAVALAVELGAAGSATWVPLETNVVVALVLWAIVLALRSRWIGAAVLAALACLTRPDALLAAGILALFGWLTARRVLPAAAATFVALGAPWPIAAALYFGSPVPRSAIVKYHASGVLAYAANILRAPVSEVVPLSWVEGSWIAVAVAWALAAGGTIYLLRRDCRLWVPVAYGGLHALAYLVLRPPIPHAWHLYPSVLVFAVVMLSALAGLAVSLSRRSLRVVAAALFGALLIGHAYRTAYFARTLETAYWAGARDHAYRDVADYLVRHTDPGDGVAAVEVGTVAYYSDLRVYDLAGLVTRREPPYGAPPYRWLMLDERLFGTAGSTPATAVFRSGEFVAALYDRRPGG